MANEEKHEPVFEEQIAQIIAELDFIYEHGTNATIAWVEDLIDVLYAHIADGRSLPHDFFISMHTQLNALRAEEDVKKTESQPLPFNRWDFSSDYAGRYRDALISSTYWPCFS